MNCVKKPIAGVLRSHLKYAWGKFPAYNYTTGSGGIDIMKRKPHDASLITLPPPVTHFLSTQRSINKKTREMFQERNYDALSQHLEKHVPEMSTSNLITVLYLSGKFSHSISDEQLQTIIDALQAKEDVFNIVDVANSCFGLQSFRENNVCLLSLVTLLTSKIQQSTESFNSQAVGMSLYGMKNLSSKTKEVRTLLLVLSERIEACRQEISPVHIASALFGLRHMDSNAWEVSKLIKILVLKVKECSGVFKAQECGNSLYGLQSMSSRQMEVRQLVSFLCIKIDENREELKTQHISNALFGLRGLRSEHAETKQLLKILCRKIDASKSTFDAQAVGNCLLGMRNMSSDHQEVRRLISCLVKKIKNMSDENMTPLQLCSAVSGLRRMRSSEKVVNELLNLLILKWTDQKLYEKQSYFSLQGLCNALHGLRFMSGKGKQVRKILSFLDEEIARANVLDSGNFNSCTSSDVASALNGLRGMDSDILQVRSIISNLTDVLLRGKNEPFSPRDMCNSLSGLRNMTGSSVELRRYLLILTSKIKHCNQALIQDIHVCHADNVSYCGALHSSSLSQQYSTQRMTAMEIVLSLNGLQRMHSYHAEVRGILVSLLPFLWSSPAVFERSEFVLMVNGLKSLKSEYVEVRSLVAYFCFALENSRGDYFDGKIVSQILNNISRMDSSHSEVCRFLEVLTLRIQNSCCTTYETPRSTERCFLDCVKVLKNSPLLDQSCPQVEKLMNILLMYNNLSTEP